MVRLSFTPAMRSETIVSRHAYKRSCGLYATRSGIKTGPIFITRDGTPLHRSTVFAYIQRLARDARVAPEKCNPRCLRKLHGTTIEAITRDLSLMIDMTYDRLLEQEELSCGWIEQW